MADDDDGDVLDQPAEEAAEQADEEAAEVGAVEESPGEPVEDNDDGCREEPGSDAGDIKDGEDLKGDAESDGSSLAAPTIRLDDCRGGDGGEGGESGSEISSDPEEETFGSPRPSYGWREELFTTPTYGNSGPSRAEITEMCIGLLRYFQQNHHDIAMFLSCFFYQLLSL